MAENREQSYKKWPLLAKYIDRVGAEQLTFRTFMVREYRQRGYYVEKALIRLNAEGELSCTDKAFEPTKDEREAIKIEQRGRDDFPRPVTASAAQFELLADKLRRRGTLHQFWNLERSGIIMVQQRIEKPGKEKEFYPWTLFSDGDWRCMEPENGLPFWKPERKTETDERGGRYIMIHEGAKTALYIDRLVNDEELKDKLAAHPFGDVLKRYTHWGMIGGALAPHRTNYDELHAERPDEVVYVCDNDFPGNSALGKVSRCYGRSLKGIQFGNGFPKSFDLADEIPAKMFLANGKYDGATWSMLTRYATHATHLLPNPAGTGRPICVINPDFAEEWYHIIAPEVYVHRDYPAKQLRDSEFNHAVRPFSDTDDTARLLKAEGACIAGHLAYDPARDPGLYPSDKGHFINTHIPSKVKAKEGDVSPFLEFMSHLVPEESERIELMRWCATLIARPDIKMSYGVLLISETQGIGKSTLGEKILAPLMGEGNVSYPGESEIVDSAFNDWAAHKRLAVVHEIYAGHSAKAYNKLKTLVTDDTIRVSKKFIPSYDLDNWLHVLACSNSMRAIQLSVDDRRWFVPRVTEDKKPFKFWQDFNHWLKEGDGLGVIKQWAHDFLVDEAPVMKGANAPWSMMKQDMIEEGFSPGMELISRTLTEIRNMLDSEEPAQVKKREELVRDGYMTASGAVLIVDADFPKLIRSRIYEGRHNDRLEKPLTARKVAKSVGWHVGKKKLPYKRWGAAHFNGRVISNSFQLASSSPEEIPAELKPLNLESFVSM